jgi:hypothetical protein
MDASKQAAIKFGCTTAAQWDQHNAAMMAQTLQVTFFIYRIFAILA